MSCGERKSRGCLPCASPQLSGALPSSRETEEDQMDVPMGKMTVRVRSTWKTLNLNKAGDALGLKFLRRK